MDSDRITTEEIQCTEGLDVGQYAPCGHYAPARGA